MMDKKKQGKKNRASGLRFESKVREDLESKGWIISKWQNNLNLSCQKCGNKMHVKPDKPFCKVCNDYTDYYIKKLSKASPGRFRMMQTGFPDFIAFRHRTMRVPGAEQFKYVGIEVISIESKTNGYLDKIEKEKCKWLLKHNIFSKILIASKGKKRGEILYKEFK